MGKKKSKKPRSSKVKYVGREDTAADESDGQSEVILFKPSATNLSVVGGDASTPLKFKPTAAPSFSHRQGLSLVAEHAKSKALQQRALTESLEAKEPLSIPSGTDCLTALKAEVDVSDLNPLSVAQVSSSVQIDWGEFLRSEIASLERYVEQRRAEIAAAYSLEKGRSLRPTINL